MDDNLNSYAIQIQHNCRMKVAIVYVLQKKVMKGILTINISFNVIVNVIEQPTKKQKQKTKTKEILKNVCVNCSLKDHKLQ